MSHHKPKPNMKADFKLVLGVILGLLVIYVLINPGAAKFPVFKPTVKITSPIDGIILKISEVKIEFEVDNWEVGSGKHVHVYIDDKLYVMHRSRDSVQIKLSEGEHKIRLALVDAQHIETGISDEIMVTVKTSNYY